ncbi:MAG TPA: biotin/lipoyl-binding protein [Anaerolineae bacterium]|nr:biotin/lipoyl-binding protein [Anaerolineae bacterium]
MKQILIILLIASTLPAVSACSEGASGFNFGQPTATPAETSTPLPTPITMFQTTISADGQIVLPIPPQTFSFQSSGLSGTLAEVYVAPGQTVKKGDLLAKIDDTDLQNALKRAETSLALLQAQIRNETAPALAGDIAEAQANLASAQAELARLESLPSEEAITQAAADLRLREIELRQAQEAYDQVAYAQNVGMSPQAAELQQATLNYERAQAVYTEATKPATDAQLAAARSSIVQAKNRLDKLQAGVRPEAQAVNEAKLRESQLQVDEAQANLIKAQLLAPWDGVVTAVNAAPGVSIANASITIAQIEPLRFATSNFSERNLADIQPGDEATIFLKTYPNVPLPAIIYRIELESTQKDGDTALYTVYLDFNSGDFEVRPGMTGRVEIAIDPKS